MSIFVEVIAKEDAGEGSMVITNMNLLEGKEHSCQRPMYNLQTNGESSPCNKRRIFKKLTFVRDGEDLTFPQQVTN